jgi:uncharacterized delta-60 repeat protein
MKRSLVALGAAAFLLVGTPAVSIADQVGLLDPTFGGDGRVTTGFDPAPGGGASEDSASAVLVQPDGRIVVAGTRGCRRNYVSPDCSIAVARYEVDGTLDPTFSGDGVVLTRFSAGAGAADVALQPDGRIVVVGSAAFGDGGTWGFAVVRYGSDGTLDPTFGGDGRVRTWFGYDAMAQSVALQSDGRIVVAGTGIARYEADGSLDAGFGTDGYLASASAEDVAIQPDGKIVTVGPAFRRFAVSRFESDGTPDVTFDGDGRTTLAAETGRLQATSVALQTDGAIVVVGRYRRDPDIRRFAVARFTSVGGPDAGFGGDGLVTTRIGEQYAIARAVVIQPDRRIVVAGGVWSGTTYQDNADVSSFAVARYDPAGALDRRFSGDGKIVTYAGLGAPYEEADSVALQADGAIVVAGEAGRNEGDFGIVRYVVPTSRPDALIRQRSIPFSVGDDAYGPPIWRQTWNAFKPHGATFVIRAENDGSSPDRFVFDGCAPTNRFSVRYFVGDTTVTGRVVAGTFAVGWIPPGGAFELRVTIRERTPATDSGAFACRVGVRSAIDDTKRDVVRAVVYTGPVACFPEGIRGYRGREALGCGP